MTRLISLLYQRGSPFVNQHNPSAKWANQYSIEYCGGSTTACWQRRQISAEFVSPFKRMAPFVQGDSNDLSGRLIIRLRLI